MAEPKHELTPETIWYQGESRSLLVPDAADLIVDVIQSYFDVDGACLDVGDRWIGNEDVIGGRWTVIAEPERSGGSALLLIGIESSRLALGKPRFQFGLGSSYSLLAPKPIWPETVDEGLDTAQRIISGRRRSFRVCVICGRTCPPEEMDTNGFALANSQRGRGLNSQGEGLGVLQLQRGEARGSPLNRPWNFGAWRPITVR